MPLLLLAMFADKSGCFWESRNSESTLGLMMFRFSKVKLFDLIIVRKGTIFLVVIFT